MIGFETIAEFSGEALRKGRAGNSLRLSHVVDVVGAIAVQQAWHGDGKVSQFHWPAVFNRNPGASTFVLHSGDKPETVEAMVQVRDNCFVPCDRGSRGPLAYVGFIEVAPWNATGRLERRFYGLGTFLVLIVSAMAVNRGASGGVGLHSLPDAAGFYQRLGFTAVDCLNEYKELYLELSDARALELRKKNGVVI